MSVDERHFFVPIQPVPPECVRDGCRNCWCVHPDCRGSRMRGDRIHIDWRRQRRAA